ncbi:MAG: hypothetical protein CVV30_03055 [Methanomicrobiales archaeon HGW-Methanomicrobiales-1]|jgi:hypothetical protein|nr:MAG: hypothetical protein CVV30_03055 [Methanomicrobiales archaeon HGW-Methanomicrobiales-1]
MNECKISSNTVPTVIVVSGDPGGANAAAPVIIRLINDDRVKVMAFAYREACNLWKEKNIPFTQLPDNTTVLSASEILSKCNAKLLFTSTSWNQQEFEKTFLLVARRLSIPSIAIIDYPSNYTIRFSDITGNPVYLPDKIAVMDATTRDEMVSEGFEPDIIMVTGQPAYDDLGSWKSAFSTEKREALRKKLGVNPGELLVVFASEPLFSGTPSRPSYPGYTKKEVLHSVISALDEIQRTCNQKITLIIRPHPRENPNEFAGELGERIHIIISTTGNSREIIMAADLVTGMTTALLVEACYLGCIVVSVQPGLIQKDILPTNRLGYSYPIYSVENVTPVLRTLLLDSHRRNKVYENISKIRSDGNATGRVVQQIYVMSGII